MVHHILCHLCAYFYGQWSCEWHPSIPLRWKGPNELGAKVIRLNESQWKSRLPKISFERKWQKMKMANGLVKSWLMFSIWLLSVFVLELVWSHFFSGAFAINSSAVSSCVCVCKESGRRQMCLCAHEAQTFLTKISLKRHQQHQQCNIEMKIYMRLSRYYLSFALSQ